MKMKIVRKAYRALSEVSQHESAQTPVQRSAAGQMGCPLGPHSPSRPPLVANAIDEPADAPSAFSCWSRSMLLAKELKRPDSSSFRQEKDFLVTRDAAGRKSVTIVEEEDTIKTQKPRAYDRGVDLGA